MEVKSNTITYNGKTYISRSELMCRIDWLKPNTLSMYLSNRIIDLPVLKEGKYTWYEESVAMDWINKHRPSNYIKVR